MSWSQVNICKAILLVACVLSSLPAFAGSAPSLETLSKEYTPYVLTRINYHEDFSKNLQLQPKLFDKLIKQNFSYNYTDDIIEEHRLESGLFSEKIPLPNGQRFFRIHLTGVPIVNDQNIEVKKHCLIQIEYREIRRVVAPLDAQPMPPLYQEVIPRETIWKEDFSEEVPYSCDNPVFLQRVAETIHNYNRDIIANMHRTMIMKSVEGETQ